MSSKEIRSHMVSAPALSLRWTSEFVRLLSAFTAPPVTKLLKLFKTVFLNQIYLLS